MALSDYVGHTPHSLDSDVTVERVAPHYYWTDADPIECPNCQAELDLGERHVVVALDGHGGQTRRFLCDETCVSEWVGVTG